MATSSPLSSGSFRSSLKRGMSRKMNMLSSNLSIKTAVSNEMLENQLMLWYASVSVFNEATGELDPVSPSQLSDMPDNLWVNVLLSKSPQGDVFKSSQGVLHWLEVLRQKFNLPALSLVDIVNPEALDPVKVDRVKVDGEETCLYTSMVAYTSNIKKGTAVSEATEGSRGMSHRDRKDDVNQDRMKSVVCTKTKPVWQRVGLFLTQSAFITFFEDDPMDGLAVFDRIKRKGLLPVSNDFRYGMGFLFYKIADSVVRLTNEVVKEYERAIIAVENVVLREGQRPTYKQDVLSTTQMHLMRNELALIKHIIAPTQRVLSTILSEYNGESSGMVGDTAVDYLEEVGDELIAVNEDIEVAIDNCEQITGLIFNLSSFNDANNGAYLTLTATVFLPLTWVCGIYGMNFEVLPELKWKLGYLYFWLVSIGIAIITAILIGVPLGFFHRMGLQPGRLLAARENSRGKGNVRSTVSNDDVLTASNERETDINTVNAV